MDSPTATWTQFFDRCLAFRTDRETFDVAVSTLHSESPLSGRKLAELLLKPRTAASITVDPRVYVYLERLLALKKVDASEALISAFKFSRDRPQITGSDGVLKDPIPWRNSPELEEVLFTRLHKLFSIGHRPISNTEAARTLIVVSSWMSTMVTSHTNDSMLQAMAGIQQHPQQQSISVREALGMLIVGLVENEKILLLLGKDEHKGVRNQFSRSLSIFIPFLSQSSLQIANRLEMSQREHDLHDKSAMTANGEAAENTSLGAAAVQLDAVLDLPLVNTRAGLYIFLNSLLVARPLTDDFTIINYLHSRYKLDAQNMATDLVTAAFDILANAMYRSEPINSMFCLKSFLVNKIPILLRQLTASIYPMTLELCITQALGHIDSNAFPPFSQGFDDIMASNSALSDVRQDFLNACALHGLIPANNVERLLGEAPMQGPPETKYTKNGLLNQCRQNSERVNMLIDELENLDGNAGAIAGAVTEFISHLCETQTTMYLKSVCNLLSRKPLALDVILQFTSPSNILRPLCQFLDEFRYEGDQGEHQPVYDEFGAILILILAFVHRYDLTYHELRISHDSFVAQLLQRGHKNMTPDEMTKEEGARLGSWLCGLLDSDKEGLSNEVFSSCRPQDFYLIVPTLFSQMVQACSCGVFSLDSVKGGLEYLHETFLLPSLVGALKWMVSNALLQTHQDLEVLMQIFHKLIRSTPTSGDAQAMHSTILSIVSSRLKKFFLILKQRHPNRTDIDPLVDAIRAHHDYERSAYASMAEMRQWNNGSTSLSSSIRQTVRQLSQWVSATSLQVNPPSYTHRQIYTSVHIQGASSTLRAIVDEIKAQTDAGNGAAALDIGVSLICAPTVNNSPMSVDSSVLAPGPFRTRSNLREMLKAEFDEAPSMVSSDPLAAATIVRLHRRVEAQLAIVVQTGLQNAQIRLADVASVDVQNQPLPDLDTAMNDAAAATMAAASADLDMNKQALHRSLDEQLDLSAAGAGLDLSSMTATTADMTAAMGMPDLPDLGDLGDMGDMGDMSMGMNMGDDDNDWGLDFNNM
ncbi:mediator complex, subunit Med5 [Massariosphaeria phaeospora]|uniref:Mediator of RNA polymerase II transcription subunit 5 n=1 Tax=Massariosphaeria phaeospora TaxID=100035 RepID=A0A7C8I7L5_9PLEO|nr:mediator complex, subunit Med5 [Massariosphaeria phaeospora]